MRSDRRSKRYAADRGWLVAEIFVDGASRQRTPIGLRSAGWPKAIKDADGSIAAVVVTKLGSLDRSLRDLCAINEDLLEPRLQSGGDPRRASARSSRCRGRCCRSSRSSVRSKQENTAERVRAIPAAFGRRAAHYGKVPFGFATVKEQTDEALPGPGRIRGWRRRSARVSRGRVDGGDCDDSMRRGERALLADSRVDAVERFSFCGRCRFTRPRSVISRLGTMQAQAYHDGVSVALRRSYHTVCCGST